MTDDQIAKLVDDRVADALGKLASTEGRAMLKILEARPGPEVLGAIVARSRDWLRLWAATSPDPAIRQQAAASVRWGEFVQANLAKRIAAKKGHR
jgi:hypothetical protein